MRSKLSDALVYAKRLRRLRDGLKKKLSKEYGENRTALRRCLEALYSYYKTKKAEEMSDARNKIDHLLEKEQLNNVIREAPGETSELLSGLSIFSPSQNELKPEPPTKPFVCDKSIELSPNELKLLARGPKYMVRDELSAEDFEVELEKMIAKKKLDTAFNKDDLKMDELGKVSAPHADQQLCENSGKSDMGKINNSKLSKANNSNILWEEQANNMVYNIKDKSFNFGNLRATSYKHNKNVFLPQPESSDIEKNHEYRKSEMRRIFKRAVHKSNAKDSKSKPNHSESIESNLSKEESLGLKSLKRRIKEGSIVVCQTDKTKRFAVLTPEQYLESGLEHTKNDVEIEPSEVKKIQKNVNDHVFWLKEVFNCGSNWGHTDRMNKNLVDKGEQTCHMTLLIKDHKKWSGESGTPPPHGLL